MTAAAETAADDTTRAARIVALPRAGSLWAWWALALAVIALRAWFTTGQGLQNFLGDMDDAARLVQVREFMAGAPWFDTSTQTMGGVAGMLSHWSRLIDAPIAAIIAAATLFAPAATAELMARTVWPLLVLAPLLWVILKSATAADGEQAGRIALALAMLTPLGIYQFDVGRIDHHNVMIATTVSAALLMWAYPGSRVLWRVAGGLSGLALIIGFEALAPVAALAVLAALWGLIDRRQARAVQGFVLVLMATVAVGFLQAIPPSRWMDIRCDAISLNIVALSAVAGGALCFALTPSRPWPIAQRFAITAAGTAAGLAVYGLLEPKCLAGPMGQLPAELKPIWLDYVAETRSILRDLFAGKIEQSLGLVVFFATGIAAQARRTRTTGQVSDLFLLAAVTAFVTFALWQYKYLSYASFIAIVPIACWIRTWRGTADVSPMAMQVIGAIVLSQASMIGVSGLLQKSFAAPAVHSEGVRVGAEACEASAAVRELDELPPGLIAARIDLGAYAVALTQHRVLSAPYHRIANAIITNHKLFAARAPADAAAILKREQIDYVVTCKGLDDPFVNEPEWQGTLRADLVGGKAPAFLEPVKLKNPNTLFSVWRVAKDKLNPLP